MYSITSYIDKYSLCLCDKTNLKICQYHLVPYDNERKLINVIEANVTELSFICFFLVYLSVTSFKIKVLKYRMDFIVKSPPYCLTVL
jgi:hypothetical protein